ncbi:hydroxymyristoyl-ACP dehydratase [Bisgaard Taxon 10/6]|uniref:ApeI family dehydratase n=1 Tax=Exercitatus varius TaxID=67857 RepID=UPI00294B664B|nr:hydroxymyristoyl-ACP dehydratase [Exercitatus varius]MDG2961311.1 hydroxymyristoyl-ACP dehydratase [Exercitatus varius]
MEQLNKPTEPQWRIIRQEENCLRLTGRVPLDLLYFAGHFDSFPLVPGVVELQWVVTQTQKWLQREILPVRIDNLKFQQFLRPEAEVEMLLIWEPEKERIKFKLTSNNDVYGSGLIVLNK